MSMIPPNPAITAFHDATPPHLRPWPLPPTPPAIHVRPRKFCCCIPVRAGTMVLSLWSAVCAFGMGIEALRELFTSLTSWWAYWAVLASCVLWFSLALICMYGFVGAWFKRREWVEWFYELCWWHIWINVVFGIWWLFILTSSPMKQLLTVLCVRVVEAANEGVESLSVDPGDFMHELTRRCESSTNLWLTFVAFCWAGALLVELWTVLIVGHTLDELEDWDAAAEGFDLEGPPPYRFVANSTGKHGRHSRSAARKSTRSTKSSREHQYSSV